MAKSQQRRPSPRATRVLKGIALTAALLAVCLFAVTFSAYRRVQSLLAPSVEALRTAPVGLVLGASVQRNKRPSAVLHDRIVRGVELLKAGKVSKLLLSGDNRETHYNEVAAMKKTAIELGADPALLVLDPSGHRTYDSCFRAREVFHISSLVVVTQRFHVSRAVYLCSMLGLDTQGIAADSPTYSAPLRLILREMGAWILALIDIHVDEPKPAGSGD